MGDADGFDFEVAELECVSHCEGVVIHFDSPGSFFHFVSDHGLGEGRAVNGDVEFGEEEGEGADVVFVGVGDNDAANFVFVLSKVGEIGDYDIDAVVLFVWEADSAIDNDDVVFGFDDGAVFTDFSGTAEGDDFYGRHEGVKWSGYPGGFGCSRRV